MRLNGWQRIGVVFSVILAAGCSAVPTPPDIDPANQCVFAIVGDPRLASIRNKIQLGFLDEPYPGVVSPNARPAPDEAYAIFLWSSAHAHCYVVGAPWRMRNAPPAARAVYANAEVWYDALRRRLQAGELTYAEYSREAEGALPFWESKMGAAWAPAPGTYWGSSGGGGCGSRGGPGYRLPSGKCASWRN